MTKKIILCFSELYEEGHSKMKRNGKVALEVGSCLVSWEGEQAIQGTTRHKWFPANHWTSGFAGTTLFTFSWCQQHSKALQEMALQAVIITGKYLASQHLSGTACDCCFTYKTLIFSVLYCISSHLETAPGGAIVSVAAGFPVPSAVCLRAGSSHLAWLTDAAGALASSEVTLAPSFSCILNRAGWWTAGAVLSLLLCGTVSKRASELLVTALSESYEDFPNEHPWEVNNLLGDLF